MFKKSTKAPIFKKFEGQDTPKPSSRIIHTETLSIALPEPVWKEFDNLSRIWFKSHSDFIQQLIIQAIDEEKPEKKLLWKIGGDEFGKKVNLP